MSLPPSISLSVATLAIYIVLVLLILFIGFRHGKHGVLGWLFLFVFASLQIIASGIQISDSQGEHPSTTVSIISTIGLSPLLLGAQGVLHEVQLKGARHTSKRDLCITIFHHQVVIVGVVLVVVGASHLYSETDPNVISHDLALWHGGASILLLGWLLTIASAALTCQNLASANSMSVNQKLRTKAMLLLRAVLISMPFIGIRTIYGLVYAATQSVSLNPSTGSMAVRVCLQFLPQLITVLILVTGGWMSFGMDKMSS